MKSIENRLVIPENRLSGSTLFTGKKK